MELLPYQVKQEKEGQTINNGGGGDDDNDNKHISPDCLGCNIKNHAQTSLRRNANIFAQIS